MRLLKLYRTFFRFNLMADMAYRETFLFGLFLTCLESLAVFAGVVILFRHVDSIAGWSYEHMLVLLGIFILSNAAAWLLFRAGISDLDQIINKGDLDGYLVKPVDTQLLVAIQRIDIEDAGRSLVGLALIIFGMRGHPITEILTRLPVFFVLFFSGQVVLYSVQLIFKSVSFKSIQGWATNSIGWRFHELAQFPTDIYRSVMRVVYTFVFPLAFVVTVPAKALTRELTVALFFGSIFAALGTFTAARLIWKLALRNYSSASS